MSQCDGDSLCTILAITIPVGVIVVIGLFLCCCCCLAACLDCCLDNSGSSNPLDDDVSLTELEEEPAAEADFAKTEPPNDLIVQDPPSPALDVVLEMDDVPPSMATYDYPPAISIATAPILPLSEGVADPVLPPIAESRPMPELMTKCPFCKFTFGTNDECLACTGPLAEHREISRQCCLCQKTRTGQYVWSTTHGGQFNCKACLKSMTFEAPDLGGALTEGVRVITNRGELGQILFVGPVQERVGVWLGVHLDKPLGLNNGTVGDKIYFIAVDKHGLFVRPNNVAPESLIQEPSFGDPIAVPDKVLERF